MEGERVSCLLKIFHISFDISHFSFNSPSNGFKWKMIIEKWKMENLFLSLPRHPSLSFPVYPLEPQFVQTTLEQPPFFYLQVFL